MDFLAFLDGAGSFDFRTFLDRSVFVIFFHFFWGGVDGLDMWIFLHFWTGPYLWIFTHF